VQVSPRAGRTKITVSEDHTMTIAASVGVGAVFAGVAAMFMANAGAAQILPLLPIAGGGAVFLLRRAVKVRREKLKGLLDRLTRHVAATARPELPGG
jgi:hypothetical protein